jgi:hypothetical protein
VLDGKVREIPQFQMIRLADSDVAEFRELYLKETGREISKDEARVYAERLIRLVAFATGSDPFPPPAP